jgi:hypothetical protein
MANDSVGGANAMLQNMGGTNWVSGRQFTALDFDGLNERLAAATRCGKLRDLRFDPLSGRM